MACHIKRDFTKKGLSRYFRIFISMFPIKCPTWMAYSVWIMIPGPYDIIIDVRQMIIPTIHTQTTVGGPLEYVWENKVNWYLRPLVLIVTRVCISKIWRLFPTRITLEGLEQCSPETVYQKCSETIWRKRCMMEEKYCWLFIVVFLQYYDYCTCRASLLSCNTMTTVPAGPHSCMAALWLLHLQSSSCHAGTMIIKLVGPNPVLQ